MDTLRIVPSHACAHQTSINEIASDIVVSYEAMAAADVDVSFSISPDVPPTALLDPLRIKQIIANGFTNALKNTMAGSVVLRVLTPSLAAQLPCTWSSMCF